MENLDVIKRYQSLQSQLAEACRFFDREPADVELLAVSKGQSSHKIESLAAHAPRISFGENYAQELKEKAEALASLSLKWHFIGQIQSNKIASIVRYAACIQSLASLKHAEKVQRHAVELQKTPYPIYVLVNLEAEASKGGIPLREVESFVEALKAYPSLVVEGLMSIPPAKYQDQASAAEIPSVYRELAQCLHRTGLKQLSLGMSGDYKLAIGAGSTQVRIGSALFGPRIPTT